MRQRYVLTFLTSMFLTFLVLTRHHLRDLAAVVRTYTTFYPYLSQHPETLYRVPVPSSDKSREEEVGADLVPPIIHQILLTEGRDAPLTRYEAAISSCQVLHPNWTHNVWIDENASAFIAQHYPDIWPHYQGYRQSIQRANILRYALLDHFGGVYLDLDVTCLQSLDELRHLPWLTPGAYPAGVNNALILSKPHHAFSKHLLSGVGSKDLGWVLPYVENMLSTGCMFFSNRWMSYVRSLSKISAESGYEDKVYILADQDGAIEPHMLRGAITTPLFKHGGASSWHGWDAAAIVFVGEHYCYFLTMMGLGAMFAIAILWKVYKRKRRECTYAERILLGKSGIVGNDEERLWRLKEG